LGKLTLNRLVKPHGKGKSGVVKQQSQISKGIFPSKPVT
jgi:hypothetical protein